MENQLNFLLSEYESLSDKTTMHAQGLSLLIRRRGEEVRTKAKRLILEICRTERWPLSRLDVELLDLEGIPLKELERYRNDLQRRYETVTIVLSEQRHHQDIGPIVQR